MSDDVICGTGHRPDKLGGYGEDVYESLVGFARRILWEERPSYVITGGALGWDQALAEAAFLEKIEFSVYIPFVEFDCKWPEHSRNRLKRIIHWADEVVVCSEPGYAAWKMQERNKRMVDESDRVFALWNGTDGGTANCVRYAEKKNTPVLNLWERYVDWQAR